MVLTPYSRSVHTTSAGACLGSKAVRDSPCTGPASPSARTSWISRRAWLASAPARYRAFRCCMAYPGLVKSHALASSSHTHCVIFDYNVLPIESPIYVRRHLSILRGANIRVLGLQHAGAPMYALGYPYRRRPDDWYDFPIQCPYLGMQAQGFTQLLGFIQREDAPR